MLNDRVYFSWGSWSLSSSACKAAWSGSSNMTPPFTRPRPRSRVSQDQALLMKLMSTSEPAKIPAKQITNVFFGWEKICKTREVGFWHDWNRTKKSILMGFRDFSPDLRVFSPDLREFSPELFSQNLWIIQNPFTEAAGKSTCKGYKTI